MVPCSLLWNLIILGHLWPFFWFVFALIFLLCLHHFLACCLCDCQTPTEPFKMAAIILPFHLQGFISDYFKWIIAFLTTNHWFSFSINFLLIFHYFSIINNFCSLCRNLLVFDKRILNNFGVFGLKNLREIVTLRPTKGGVTTLFIPLNHSLKTWRYEIALYRWFVVFFFVS